MTRPTSSRRRPIFFWNVLTSSRVRSVTSVIGAPFMRPRRSIARPDQLKIPANVEAVAARDVVLRERLLCHRLVVGEHFLVAATDEAALGSAVDDGARRRA